MDDDMVDDQPIPIPKPPRLFNDWIENWRYCPVMYRLHVPPTSTL